MYNPYMNGYNMPNFNSGSYFNGSFNPNNNASQNGLHQSNKIYVSGLDGARSYQLYPNTEVILCDDNNDIIYDVVIDSQGKRTINTFDIVKHEEKPQIDISQFATKEDIANIKKELSKLRGDVK